MRKDIGAITAFSGLMLGVACSSGAPIHVPNRSFESPATPFVSINIESWQKTPKPDWYSEDGDFLWTQLTGAFKNPATNAADHIRNCDGNQAIWLFVVPEAGLFQDYDSVDLDDPAPTHAFDAKFEVGKSYHLTVGVIGSGGGMQQGATLELSLFYRDASSNRVTVAATTVTNLPTVFSNNTQLVDCHLDVPAVRAADAWANKNIGILLLSTVTTNLQGGYWDLDNVRLSDGPALLNPVKTHDEFRFSLLGEVGARFEILTAPDLAWPASNWSSLGTLTNTTRVTPLVDTNADFQQRFYRARQLP